ncbi:hypothetical protein TcCL_Unassigned00011 [Trypanosoma cruzi]|nr:hypothetical protein TcCL_Unassigned00011 [Trypanosoma cruzi]
MINTSLADSSLRSCWETGKNTSIREHGKDACRTERVAGPSRCSLPLLGVSEGLVHSRLSALLAHHRCQPVSTPRRTASDVMTLVSEKTARGLSECERRSGRVPRCTVAVTALSPSRSASRLRSTPRTKGECWPCSTGYRAWAVAPNAGSKSPASGCVWVSARQEYF